MAPSRARPRRGGGSWPRALLAAAALLLAAFLWSDAGRSLLAAHPAPAASLRSVGSQQQFADAFVSKREGEAPDEAAAPEEEPAEEAAPEEAAAEEAAPEEAAAAPEESPSATAAPESPSPSPTAAPASPSPSAAPATPSPSPSAAPATPSPTPPAQARRELPYRSLSGEAPAVPADWRAEPPLDLVAGSPYAYVTMAAGNEAGRMAVALMQSIVSSGTDPSKIDLVVLLPSNGLGSPECHDAAWRAAHNRTHVACGNDDRSYSLICEEVISPVYCAALTRLGAKPLVHHGIPPTQWTLGISGGPQASWGMSLQRMVLFNLTQYKKVVWSDADTLVLRNMDHLFGDTTRTLTSSFTHACCNPNAPAIPGGGLWVVEPSAALGLLVWRMLNEGMPAFERDGSLALTPLLHRNTVRTQVRKTWHYSDMSLIQHMFSDWDRAPESFRTWPWVRDARHGYAPGIRTMPLYAGLSDEQFEAAAFPGSGSLQDGLNWRPPPGLVAEGFRPERVAPEDNARPVWHALPVQYDQCVSNCDCIPWRWPSVDAHELFSVHFSCNINGNEKPGKYTTEREFYTQLEGWTDCAKYYYMAWYTQLRLALGGPLGGVAYEGELPLPVNMTVLTQRPTRKFVPFFLNNNQMR